MMPPTQTDILLALLVLVCAWNGLQVHELSRSLRAVYFGRPSEAPAGDQPSAPAQTGTVEILQLAESGWIRHSTRPEGHKDIAEALETPGLAIARGGVIEEGVQ